MNHPQSARLSAPAQALLSNAQHLDWLEEEAIFILRETVAAFERPALLFSSGKDSCVVLHLAEKAFKTLRSPDAATTHPRTRFQGRLPMPLLHSTPATLPRSDAVPRRARGRAR